MTTTLKMITQMNMMTDKEQESPFVRNLRKQSFSGADALMPETGALFPQVFLYEPSVFLLIYY